VSGSRFPNQNRNGVNYGIVSPEQKAQVEKLIALLRQHGALDYLPDWNRIIVRRPSANYSAAVFQKGTNDWNHFTLLELLYWAQDHVPHDGLNFPDLSRIVVMRPSAHGAESKRIAVNLLNATNVLDAARDLPLEFGDVVEIPEREHSLAESPVFLSSGQDVAILNHFRDATGMAGEAKLVVAGGKSVQLPLQPFFSTMAAVLRQDNARAALSSKSDLSRIKIIRRDATTGKKTEWILDCSKLFGENNSINWNMVNWSNDPGIWLRNGDVIEVPEK